MPSPHAPHAVVLFAASAVTAAASAFAKFVGPTAALIDRSAPRSLKRLSKRHLERQSKRTLHRSAIARLISLSCAATLAGGLPALLWSPAALAQDTTPATVHRHVHARSAREAEHAASHAAAHEAGHETTHAPSHSGRHAHAVRHHRTDDDAEATLRATTRATMLPTRRRHDREDRDAVAAGPLPAPVMRDLAHAHIPVSSVSALVIRLDTDQRVLDYNTETPMQPASTEKTVTSYAALSMLGAGFRWQTSAFIDGPIDNGVLHGNLYIEGTGDPFLVPEQLTDLIDQLRRAGIQHIAGDLVLDKGYFDLSTRNAAPIDDSLTAPYNVGPDPLLYAFKSLTIDVSPDAGGHAAITVQPPLAQVRVSDDIRITRGACRSTQAATPDITHGADGTLNLHFDGVLSSRCGEQENSIAVLDQTSFFSGGFLALWQQAGGTFTGSVREAPVPVAAQRIAVHYSPPLPEIIKSMNKVSNNTMARNIYLTIGAVAFKPPATLEGAQKMVDRWLRHNHIESTGLVMDNGSGLSRDARISTNTMGEILQSAFHSPVAQPLMDSFPTVGVDGTMRHRLTHTGITGHAQIKTGTLGNVRAIAGYVFAANGHPYLVVSFINDPRSEAGGAAHDALLNWVYEQP